MSEIAKMVMTTTRELSKATNHLPTPVLSAFTAFNTVHRVWRWFSLGRTYTNPDNFLKLAAGHGLNLAMGDSLIVRMSAICVLIATQILECVEQQVEVQKAWDDVVHAVCNHYPTPIKVTWERRTTYTILSSSTVAWWQFHAKDTLMKTQRSVSVFFHFCKECFVLSMRIADAIDTFSLSPSTQNVAVNLLFVNGSFWIDRMVENKGLLINGLVSNKKIIEKILKGVHCPITAEQLIQNAMQTLNKAEQAHLVAESINKGGGVFITACVKKWGFEFMHGLGLHHLIPKEILPSSLPPWQKAKHKKIKVRYPPSELLTKPSKLKKGTIGAHTPENIGQNKKSPSKSPSKATLSTLATVLGLSPTKKKSHTSPTKKNSHTSPNKSVAKKLFV